MTTMIIMNNKNTMVAHYDTEDRNRRGICIRLPRGEKVNGEEEEEKDR